MPAPSPVRPDRWIWLVFPAVTMSFGWALRGFIGGGPLGAMIPGVMIALAVCLLLGRRNDAPFIAACGALGIAFGGEETYGQTVGLSLRPETFWWAITGFAVKGGVWGLLGGAVLGAGFTRHRYAARDLAAGYLCILAGTWAGWKLLNEPKLIYFSNPVDKPRPEVWAGLLLAALLFLSWLSWRGGAALPTRFALWGLAGGSTGFAAGAALQVWGKNAFGEFPLGWWKVMELTFGALLGLAYGWCAWQNRESLRDAPLDPEPPVALIPTACWAAIAIALGILLEYRLHTRFNFVIAGTALLFLALYFRPVRWQAAISLTYCAFALDLLESKSQLPQPALWVFVVATTLAMVLFTAKRPTSLPLFLAITWSAVAVSVLKSFIPFSSWHPLMMETLFLAMGAACTIWALNTAECKEA